MAWSYRKRIKIAPGVLINVSKRGISTSIGPRGASITMGKNGSYLNTGIPGTGIYQRRKISGPTSVPQTSNFTNNMNTTNTSNNGGGHTRWVIFFIALGIFNLIIGGLSQDKSTQQVFLVVGGICIFIGFTIAVASISSDDSGISKKESNILSKARLVLESSSNGTEKEILSCYINSKTLEQEKATLEKIVAKLSKKAEKSDNAEIKEQLLSYQDQLEIVNAKLNTSYFDADKDLSDEQIDAFKKVTQTYKSLSQSRKIWEVTSEHASAERKSSAAYNIERKEVTFSLGGYLNIHSQFEIPLLRDAFGNSYYIYPNFIIKTKTAPNFTVEPISSSLFRYSSTRFIETEGVPADSQVIDRTWMYVNKNGGPDRRYSYNPERKVVGYGDIKSDKLGVTFMISNREVAEQFIRDLSNFAGMKNSSPKSNVRTLPKVTTSIDSVTQEYFEDTKRATQNISSFIDSLKRNSKFCDHISSKVNANIVISGKSVSDPAEVIKYLSFADIIRCYKGLGHQIDIDQSETLGLLFYTLLTLNANLELTYEHLDIILEHMKESTQDLLNQFDKNKSTGSTDAFIILECLRDFDSELQKKYAILLYRFASIVAKADNTITEEEAKWLDQIMALKDSGESNETHSNIPQPHIKHPESKSVRDMSPYKELESLIGLNSVKQEITSLANYVKIQQIRQSKGLKTSPVSYHCVFTGNPGTGKTTVARIVAEIYKDLGILKKGHLVETDRSGLVAEYVGQTAVKTNQIIDSALDGVLFIDEAYSLISDSKSDYGKEAIATLLKRMEDDRERLVVILAGYSNEMKDFIDSNPGLQSRFNRYIEFPDYSADELDSIYCSNAKKYEYSLTESAKTYLHAALDKAVVEKDKNFGNGRFVRNLFEKTVEHQANRLSREAVISTEILTKIDEEDIKNALPNNLRVPKPVVSQYIPDVSYEAPKNETPVDQEKIEDCVQYRTDWETCETDYKSSELEVISANPDLLVESVYDVRIKENIFSILSIEAPISKDLLNRKVLSSLGISRVGPRLYTYLDRLYTSLYLQKTGNKVEFYWDKDQIPEEYNEYRPSSGRDAVDISPEEVSNGMHAVLKNRVSLGIEDLLRETARLFNYARLGTNVQISMLAGLKKAQERGIIIVEGEKCYLPNNE